MYDKKLPARSQASAVNQLPHPSKICDNTNCDNEADVYMLYVLDRENKTRCARPDKYIVMQNGKYVYQLVEGYRFKRWISRCCACYAREVEAAGRSSLQSARHAAAEKERVSNGERHRV